MRVGAYHLRRGCTAPVTPTSDMEAFYPTRITVPYTPQRSPPAHEHHPPLVRSEAGVFHNSHTHKDAARAAGASTHCDECAQGARCCTYKRRTGGTWKVCVETTGGNRCSILSPHPGECNSPVPAIFSPLRPATARKAANRSLFPRSPGEHARPANRAAIRRAFPSPASSC